MSDYFYTGLLHRQLTCQPAQLELHVLPQIFNLLVHYIAKNVQSVLTKPLHYIGLLSKKGPFIC